MHVYYFTRVNSNPFSSRLRDLSRSCSAVYQSLRVELVEGASAQAGDELLDTPPHLHLWEAIQRERPTPTKPPTSGKSFREKHSTVAVLCRICALCTTNISGGIVQSSSGHIFRTRNSTWTSSTDDSDLGLSIHASGHGSWSTHILVQKYLISVWHWLFVEKNEPELKTRRTINININKKAIGCSKRTLLV